MPAHDRPNVPQLPRVQRPARPQEGTSSASRWGALIAAWLGSEPTPSHKPARVVRAKAPARRGSYATSQRRAYEDELWSACGPNVRRSTSFDDWALAKPSVFRVHVDLVRTEIDRGAERFPSRDRVFSSHDGPRFRIASF